MFRALITYASKTASFYTAAGESCCPGTTLYRHPSPLGPIDSIGSPARQ